MTNALKLAIALALLVALAAAGLFLWLRPAGPAVALELDQYSSTPVEPTRDVPVDAQGALAAESTNSERTSVPKEAKSAAETSKPSAEQAEALVVAHIVDENMRPIQNAWLCPAGDAMNSGKSGPKLEARTGSDGVATLHWKGPSTGYSASFVAGADGYAMVFPRGIPKAGETLHLGDLTLRPGGAVRGRVLDGEQRPVAGAQVVVSEEHTVWGSNDLEQLRSRGPSLWMGAPETKSGADGSFLVEGVAAGMTRAWAKSEQSRWAVSAPLEVAAGAEVRDLLLLLDAEEQADPELRDIEGIVVGPDDKPIPKAKMQVRQQVVNSSWSSGMNAEADGRFRVHPRERGVKITLEFSDPKERYTHVKLEEVKPGTKDLVVRLEEPKRIVIAVRDERGPLEEFRVRWGSESSNLQAYADVQEPHADGRAQLRVPSRSFWYQVEAAGHMPEKLGPLDGDKLPAELEVKLRTIPGIHGRVLAGDAPVAGAKLGLYQQPTNAEIEMNGFTTLLQTNADVETTSGSDGSFTLDLQTDGSFSILAEAGGYARAQSGPLQLEASKGLLDLVIRLDVGGTLEGKVLMPPGRSPAGVIVGINRGDAHPFTLVVGPEGAFRFDRLCAGAWELQRAEEMFHGPTSTSMSMGDDTKAREIRRDFTIAVGQTTRMDLDLRNSNPCVLEIELLNNGQPARAWAIVAWPKGKHTYSGSPPSAATDSSGRARIEVDDPGECSLTLRPPAEAGSEFDFHADVTLQRGPNNWNQDLRTGRIEGSIAGWQPDAATKWRLAPRNGGSGQSQLHPDAAGHFTVPFASAGTVEVQRSKGEGHEQTWETVQTFELAAAEAKTLQLP